MKLIKKIGAIALVLLVFLVMLVLVLMGFASQWQASIKPLSVEEVRRLAATPSAPRPVNPDAPKPQSSAKAELQADDKAKEEGECPGEDPSVPAKVSAKAENAPLRPPNPTGLASQPTKEQVRKWFRYYLDDDIPKARVRAFTERIVCSAIWTATRGATGDFSGQTPRLLGRAYLRAQDFETARDFFREAVRVEKDECRRRFLCCDLAWFEDDPQVAAALLEESCAGPVWSGPNSEYFTIHAQYNALGLCIATGSEELANYYYERYRGSWPQWMGEPAFAGSEDETVAWLHERLVRDNSK